MNNKSLSLPAADPGGQGCVKPPLDTVVAGNYNPAARPLFTYVNKTSTENPR